MAHYGLVNKTYYFILLYLSGMKRTVYTQFKIKSSDIFRKKQYKGKRKTALSVWYWDCSWWWKVHH